MGERSAPRPHRPFLADIRRGPSTREDIPPFPIISRESPEIPPPVRSGIETYRAHKRDSNWTARNGCRPDALENPSARARSGQQRSAILEPAETQETMPRVHGGRRLRPAD